MTSSLSRYKLSETRHEAVYRRIERLSFLDTSTQEAPRAVILGGQPGAGKSKLLEQSYCEIPQRNAVKINGDDFRQWHPQIKEILREDEAGMAAHTDPDVRVWTKRLFDTTIETRRNVIFEGTMRVKDAISNTMERLRGDGYNVTARVIAAHERQSIAGIHTRFETQKRESGHGRMAPIEVHDQAYIGMLDTIENIEVNSLADQIQVFNRAGEVIHDAKLINGVWDKPGARASIESERAREPSLDEARTFVTDWKHIFNLMDDRGATTEEIAAARKIASKHISEIYPILSAQEDITLRVIDIQLADSVAGKSFDKLVVSSQIEVNADNTHKKKLDSDSSLEM